MFLDRRTSPRVPEFRRAQIVFNDNRSRILCIVVNSSEKGAMLRVREATEVPDTFDLHINGEVPAAWIVWKGTGAVGVNWID
jgi:PilZ domain-containing protein